VTGEESQRDRGAGTGRRKQEYWRRNGLITELTMPGFLEHIS
jgi:hypothetical protein